MVKHSHNNWTTEYHTNCTVKSFS